MKHKHARTLIYIEASGKYQAVCKDCGRAGTPREDKTEALKEPLSIRSIVPRNYKMRRTA